MGDVFIALVITFNCCYMAGLWYFGSGWEDNRD